MAHDFRKLVAVSGSKLVAALPMAPFTLEELQEAGNIADIYHKVGGAKHDIGEMILDWREHAEKKSTREKAGQAAPVVSDRPVYMDERQATVRKANRARKLKLLK